MHMLSHRLTARSWRDSPQRRGAIAVLAALLLVLFFAFLAFTCDIGFLALTKAKLQNAADSAALAAAQELNPIDPPATVRAAAQAAAQQTVNANLGTDAKFFNVQQDLQFGKQTYNAATQKYTYTWGDNATPYNVVRVTAQRGQRVTTQGQTITKTDERIPLFFAPVVGITKADLDVTGV